MTEPDPAKQPPLTCANDHDGNICELCIALMVSLNNRCCLNLCQEYDALYEQNLRNHNLLQAAMNAHHLGVTNETYNVEQQLEQDLNACWDLNYNLLHRLDNQNLEIASVCLKNEAYEYKGQKQDD
jgi:hypothetical protein